MSVFFVDMKDILYLTLKFQIQAAQAKQYEADWLENAKTVWRNPDGKFAKKGQSQGEVGEDDGLVGKFHNWAQKFPAQLSESGAKFVEAQQKIVGELLGVVPQIPAIASSTVSAMFDNAFTWYQKLKKGQVSKEEAVELAKQIMGNAVGLGAFYLQAFGPDLLIGLAVGESLPLILGGALVFGGANYVLQKEFDYLDIDNPWVEALGALAMGLYVGGITKSLAQMANFKKFAGADIATFIEAGETADSLQNIANITAQEAKKVAKGVEQAREKRAAQFLNAIEVAAARGKDAKGKFWNGLLAYLTRQIPQTQNVYMNENFWEMGRGVFRNPMAWQDERELKGFVKSQLMKPELKAALEEVGIDAKKLTQRLAELTDMSGTTPFNRQHRKQYVKDFVKRVGELPEAIAKSKSPKLNENADLVLEKFQGLTKLTSEFSEELKKQFPNLSKADIDRIVDPNSIFHAKKEVPDFSEFTTKTLLMSQVIESFRKIQRQLIDEITEIDNASCEMQLGAAWRKNLIDVEMKHGKQFDEFLDSIAKGSEDLHLEYTKFIGSLVGDKKGKSKVIKLSIKEMDEYADEMAESSDRLSFEQMFKPAFADNLRIQMVDDASKNIDLFERISDVDIGEFKLVSLGFRPFVHLLGEKGRFFNVGFNSPRELFHEMAHLAEFNFPDGVELAQAFRNSRRTASGTFDMALWGMPGERAVFDKFTHPYVGRQYDMNPATEITSMAIEKLASAEALYKQGIFDREHLMFGLSMLKGGSA